MDEHTERPESDTGPDPLLSPLHEGQMSLMPEPDSRPRDFRPQPGDDPWSSILPAASSADAGGGATDEASDPLDTPGVLDPEAGPTLIDHDTPANAVDDESTPDSDDPSDSAEKDADELAADGDPTAVDGDSAPVPAETDVMPDDSPGSSDVPDAGSSLDTPAESEDTVWPGLRVPQSSASTYDLPPLDRPRPHRDRLVPKWVYIALGSVLGALLLIVGGVFWYLSAAQVAVPDVTGQPLSAARTRLEKAGFEVQVTDRRFSAVPRDEVLEQDPASGAELRRGEVVKLVVSAGTEEIVMPDVVGDGLATAREELERRGLVIIIDVVPSDVPSDTVLGSTPAAGAIVRTGDQVRLSVAAPVGGTNGLSPYVLQGLGVVIDPAPTGTAGDTTMEIARRLRSLLEASGATVTTLRSATETAATDITRAQAATTATGTIAIGLSVTPSGPAGRHISIPVTGTPDVLQRSQLLSSSISSQLVGVAAPVTSSTSSTETVLQATRLPWARVVLGSTAAREDQTRFADPTWADQMARAIYNALGQLYGVRE